MLIGYVRVSKEDQSFDIQMDALRAAGVEKFYQDKASGAKDDRKSLQEMIEFARPGDIITVWRLDRLGRSLKMLIALTLELQQRGIEFKSLTEQIDTTTPSGKFMFHIMGALAEMERDIIRQRTMAGLEAARARGRFGGRPKLVLAPKVVKRARALYDKKEMTVKEIMAVTGITNRGTFYKHIVHAEPQSE